MNPYNTVFDAKRLIGRKFADAEVQSDMKHWPFKVLDKGGKPVIQVEYRGEEKTFVSGTVGSTRDSIANVFLRPPRRSLRWYWSR